MQKFLIERHIAGVEKWGPDQLKAVAAGVRFVRDACRPLQAKGLIDGEMAPGADITDSGVEGFVRDNAWGHHASCTCPMGDRGA